MSEDVFVWDRGPKLPGPESSCAVKRFVYPGVISLAGLPLVGKGECVELIQHYMPEVGHTTTWEFEEKSVIELFPEQWKGQTESYVWVGTVVGNKTADGKWPGKNHGNHVCFFHLAGSWSVDTHELHDFTVIDQFVSSSVSCIQIRRLKRKGKGPDGQFIDPSNNADAFFPLKRVVK